MGEICLTDGDYQSWAVRLGLFVIEHWQAEWGTQILLDIVTKYSYFVEFSPMLRALRAAVKPAEIYAAFLLAGNLKGADRVHESGVFLLDAAAVLKLLLAQISYSMSNEAIKNVPRGVRWLKERAGALLELPSLDSILAQLASIAAVINDVSKTLDSS